MLGSCSRRVHDHCGCLIHWKRDIGVQTGAWLHDGAPFLNVLYQVPPVVAEQQGDTRTVTIPRRIAENALIEEYREKLRGMSDEDIARLFEEDILVMRSNVNTVRQVLKEFPAEEVLRPSNSPKEQEEQKLSSSSTPFPIEDMDETALLLQGGDDDHAAVADADTSLQRVQELFGRIFDNGLVGISGTSKDLAVPIMGTGALVLGVALMYALISTLSNVKGDESSAPEEASTDLEEQPFDPSSDPYTMYNGTVGTGEVIWQRKEEDGESARQQPQRDLDEDPWRTPMNDVKPLSNSSISSSENTEGASSKRTQLENKRPPPLDQILDNAESISHLSGKRGQPSLQSGGATRSKTSS